MPAHDRIYSAPEIPPDEEERLAELYGLDLLDTASEVRFDRYTALVADLFEFPIVLVTFIDSNRQWFKSASGLSIKETIREVSFCAHAILQHDVLVVSDARADARFAANPLVSGPPYIRFYAGAVVHGPSGRALGTLCLLDRKPRHFSEDDRRRLRRFADLVQSEISHTHDLANLRAALEFSAFYDPLTQLPNKRLLMDRLQMLLNIAGQRDEQVAVLLINISELL